jgi:hypothetical protein
MVRGEPAFQATAALVFMRDPFGDDRLARGRANIVLESAMKKGRSKAA